MTTRDAQSTARRTQIVAFVNDFREQHGVGPTMNEIAIGVGLSRTAVRHHVAVLEESGKLVRSSLVRSIRVAS